MNKYILDTDIVSYLWDKKSIHHSQVVEYLNNLNDDDVVGATGNIPTLTAKAVISTGLVLILIDSNIASRLLIPSLIPSRGTPSALMQNE